VFRLDPAKGYVKQPGGGATSQGAEINFTYAESWAENIWADMLS